MCVDTGEGDLIYPRYTRFLLEIIMSVDLSIYFIPGVRDV